MSNKIIPSSTPLAPGGPSRELNVISSPVPLLFRPILENPGSPLKERISSLSSSTSSSDTESASPASSLSSRESDLDKSSPSSESNSPISDVKGGDLSPEPAKKETCDEWAKRALIYFQSDYFKEAPEEWEQILKDGSEFINEKSKHFSCGTIFHLVAKRNALCSFMHPILKNAGLNPALQDSWGNTGLMWAIANAANSMAMLILLVLPSGPYLNVQCKMNKNTALHLAVGKGYKNVSADKEVLAFSNLKLMKTLISKKADVNIQNADGNTPLHLACVRRDVDMIRELLAAGADPGIKNMKGKTAEELLKLSFSQAKTLLYATVQPCLLEKEKFDDSDDASNNLKEALDCFAHAIAPSIASKTEVASN